MSLRNFEKGSEAYNYVQWMNTQKYESIDDEREDDRWLVYMNTKAPSETVPSETVPSETVPSETVPSETVPSETDLSETFLQLNIHHPNEKEIIEQFFNNLPNENKSQWQLWAIEKKDKLMNRLIVWSDEDIDDLESKVVELWMDMIAEKKRKKRGTCL